MGKGIKKKRKVTKQTKKTRKAPTRRKARKKPARVEAYTMGEAQAGRGFPW